MKIVKIKQSDLNRLINEQIGGTSTIDLGKKIFDVGKSTVDYVKSKFGDKEQKTSQKVDIKPFSIDNLNNCMFFNKVEAPIDKTNYLL